MSEKLDQLRINAAIEEIDDLRTIAAQLAEALTAIVGNEINADHPWPRAVLKAWEKYNERK